MNTNVVASKTVNSIFELQPPRPANSDMNSSRRLPGAPLRTAVANNTVNSTQYLRPPRPARTWVNSNTSMLGALFPLAARP